MTTSMTIETTVASGLGDRVVLPRTATLTINHAASRYGLPVVVLDEVEAHATRRQVVLGPAECGAIYATAATREERDLLAAARRAGYTVLAPVHES